MCRQLLPLRSSILSSSCADVPETRFTSHWFPIHAEKLIRKATSFLDSWINRHFTCHLYMISKKLVRRRVLAYASHTIPSQEMGRNRGLHVGVNTCKMRQKTPFPNSHSVLDISYPTSLLSEAYEQFRAATLPGKSIYGCFSNAIVTIFLPIIICLTPLSFGRTQDIKEGAYHVRRHYS